MQKSMDRQTNILLDIIIIIIIYNEEKYKKKLEKLDL